MPDIFPVDDTVKALPVVADLDEYKMCLTSALTFVENMRAGARSPSSMFALLGVNDRSLSVVSHGNQTDRSSDASLE